MRVPGIEPGSTAWKAAMLTATQHTWLKCAMHVASYIQLCVDKCGSFWRSNCTIPSCGPTKWTQRKSSPWTCELIFTILETFQRLTIRLVTGLRQIPYEESVRQLNLLSMEWRRLRDVFILAFKVFKRLHWPKPISFIPSPTANWTERVHLQNTARTKLSSLKKVAFSVRVVKY